MKNKVIDRLVELLKVKSLITVITFFTFSYLSLKGKIDTDNFMFVMGLITTYFFNKDKISN